MAFSGFTRGTLYTPVPNPLFGPLLEEIQDVAELKVTLRGLWLFHRQRGWPRMVPLTGFTNDRALLRGLGGQGKDAVDDIRKGLGLAVGRGTFLVFRPQSAATSKESYLLNTESDRRALEHLQREGTPDSAENESPVQDPPAEWETKPNIFVLYEENVGMLSPILAEELKDAEEIYPSEWIRQAFEIAVTENKRNWRYIAGILRRWAAEGKDHGKPGRHPKEDSRQKYYEDYQRRWGRLPRERTRR